MEPLFDDEKRSHVHRYNLQAFFLTIMVLSSVVYGEILREIERKMKIRPRVRIRSFAPVFVGLLLFLTPFSLSLETCAPPASSNSYDWESLDYYQILGLTEKTGLKSRRQRARERANIKSPDVRKAYRKQAQLFHPDKIKNNATSTISEEESNARFSRIAEAYKVLNDEQQRQEYDHFLLSCEDAILARQQGAAGHDSSSSSDSRWSLFDNLSTDPRRVFEEFFFGSSSASSWDDVYDDDYSSSTTAASQSHQHQHPVRVSESREMRYDPYRGTDVLRVLSTEEFAPDEQGNVYYRVLAQEFVEQYDRYQGWVYAPVGPAVILEDGYLSKKKKEESNGPRSDMPNILWPGDVLTPDSTTLLTSANGRYYAGLSPECELLIMSDATVQGRDTEDTVLWSSGTYVPSSQVFRARDCYLSIRGRHLVLALGRPERPGTVLWYSSDVSETALEEEERIRLTGGPPPLYFARLDDDGSLAVYSQLTVPQKHTEDDDDDDDDEPHKYTWWSRILRPPTARAPQTRAARAWVRVREWTHRQLVRKMRRPRVREICVFATGPAGCNAHGRKLVHFATDVGQSIKRTIAKIDQAIDNFVESLGEEDDEDLLDSLLRILSKSGSGICRVGKRFATKGAKAVRQAFRDRLYLA